MIKEENHACPQLQVAIIGLGLLGASLTMALAQHQRPPLVWARKPEPAEYLIKHCYAAATGELAAILAQANLVVLALPVPVICDFVATHASEFKKGTVVTDIGSVKGVIVQRCTEALAGTGVHFVGSHPMAGTEKSGHLSAFPTLYEEAEVFVTPDDKTDQKALKLVTEFWESLNTRVWQIDPERHDLLVAHTSHISHLLASALSLTVLDCPNDSERQLRSVGCAGGFRDTSRIASSSPAMWREIIENNVPAVLEAAERFQQHYDELCRLIREHDFDGFEVAFARGRDFRDRWLAERQKGWQGK